MGLIDTKTEKIESMSLAEMKTMHEDELILVTQIDQLATLCVQGDGDLNELEQKLQQYIQNVKKHFAYEEEIMLAYNFPSYDMHKLAHDMFLADMTYATKIWNENGDLNKIVRFVRKSPEWIESHIKSVDTPTVEYIARKQN
ncbi:MAG: Unknown protein [uncultured Sulfurovum sp.]|uniref:Hemerythrin-like domain-containing protein n=1 Tax=uncultured Sulfurovum sp. TaxID=269237 RepID=A0A6S6TZY6_9BACT|nr:MAG: Unknown protein [uncultured Sulfurovum sp.]